MTIHKKGQAHWEGDIKRGKGTVSTESGVLNQQPYGFNTRFEGAKGTNPEELIGAAHAACFSMALSLMLGEAGFTPDAIDTTADVSLDKVDAGFAITKVALHSQVSVPGIDAATFDGIIQKAKSRLPGITGTERGNHAGLSVKIVKKVCRMRRGLIRHQISLLRHPAAIHIPRHTPHLRRPV